MFISVIFSTEFTKSLQKLEALAVIPTKKGESGIFCVKGVAGKGVNDDTCRVFWSIREQAVSLGLPMLFRSKLTRSASTWVLQRGAGRKKLNPPHVWQMNTKRNALNTSNPTLNLFSASKSEECVTNFRGVA